MVDDASGSLGSGGVSQALQSVVATCSRLPDAVAQLVAAIAGSDSDLVGESVNIARGEEVTVNRVVDLILRECGRADLRAEHGPDRPADVRRHYGDISRARRELGFAPLVDITDGIRRYVHWFRDAYPDIGAVAAQEQPVNWQPIPK